MTCIQRGCVRERIPQMTVCDACLREILARVYAQPKENK